MIKDAVISHPDLFLIETLILPAVENAGSGQLLAESLSGYCLWWKEGPCPRFQSPPPGHPESNDCSLGNAKAQLPALVWDISAEPSQLWTLDRLRLLR